MKVRILGSGGSFGSPLAWQRNGKIDINNQRNFRTRYSVLVNIKETTSKSIKNISREFKKSLNEIADESDLKIEDIKKIDVKDSINILIDTSPDLRQQLYDAKCTQINTVLFTHGHSDHTSGLPDMRSISLINDKIIPAFAPIEMKKDFLSHYKFIFQGDKDYRPFMEFNTVQNEFQINNIKIESFKHNHGSIDVQTYRIGNFAYSTDLKKFYNNDIDKLKNLDLWVVGMLRWDSHPSHAGFDEIMEYVNYLKPKKTIFTHMTALIDEKELLNLCPQNVIPGYDGLEISI